MFDWSDTAPALSKLDQLVPIGPRAGDIYSRLFKFTQQHTSCFTDNNWALHLMGSCAKTIVSERVLNRDNMFEWIDISICADCCFRELALRKSSPSWFNDSVLTDTVMV